MLDTPTRFYHLLSGSTLAGSSDFTGDGKVDVFNVASNGYVAVSPGRGDGTFASGVYTTPAGQVRGIADFDDDGSADLYIKKPGFAYAIMLGAGDGTFGPAIEGLGTTPDLLTAGDFNGDTFDDLVTYTASAGTLTLYAGNGTGGFLPAASSPISFAGSVRDIANSDFDGDGKLDLILTGDGQSAIAWNSGGAFTALQLPQMAGKAVAAGDVNGDGRADAVVINYVNIAFTGTASVAFGSSGRSISVTQFPIEGGTQGDVTIAQMDGLGGSDIVIAMRDVTIHSYDGVGFRIPRSHAISEADAGAVTTADFDGDGKMDVVVSPSIGISMSFLRGNGDGTLATDPAFAIRPVLDGGFKQAVNVSDLNGDGRLDLTLLQYDGLNLAVAFGTAGGFATPVLTPIPAAQTVWNVHRAGDLNADGRADVMLTSVSQSAPAQFSTWFAQANGTFTAGPVTTGAAASRAMLVADLTGDGRSDVVDNGGRLYTALGSGGFSASTPTTVTATLWMYAADLNNDGKIDVITWAPPEPGVASVRAYFNNGGGSFSPAVSGGGHFNFVDGIVDATGDGLADLISFGEIHRGVGDGTFVGPLFTIPQPDFVQATPWSTDFDGDGNLDVAVSGAISYGAGDGTFDGVATTAVKGEIFSLADLDGNGSPDLWLADAALGRIAVIRTRRQRPTGTVSTTLSVGAGGSPTTRTVSVGGQVLHANDAAVVDGSVFVKVNSTNAALALVTTNWSTHALVPTGTSTISAFYSGDAYYAPSNASTTITVEKRPSNIDFHDSFAYPEYGSPVILCARAYSDAIPYPTGNITYSKGTTTLGTSPAWPTAPCQGALSVNDPALFPAGLHTVHLEYPGDDGYLSDETDPTFRVRKASRALSLSIQPDKPIEGQQVTITASLASGPGITGNVSFTWNGTTYSAPVANGQAVLSTLLPWGNGAFGASYSGNSNYEVSTTSIPLVVYRGTMSTAPIVRATAVASGAAYLVTIAYSQTTDAASYDLYHSVNGAPLTFFMNRLGTQAGYPTETLTAGSVGVYAVVARATGGGSSPMSARDLASAFTFTDDPLQPMTTIARGSHMTQLQNAVNAVRTAAGLPTASFAAPTGTISGSHLTSLRQALTQARSALGLTTPLTDPTITPGVTPIRALHLQELRDAVK